MLASYYGHAELVKLLLQHGADPNRLNDKGQSPLAGAVFKMEDAVIEVGFSWPLSTSEPNPSPCLGLTADQALLEGGADPEFGEPNALQCVVMFKQEGKWKTPFESAPGRGRAKNKP